MRTVAWVLDWHLEHYPLLRAQDVYKLVHQGVFGPGHLMKDADSRRPASFIVHRSSLAQAEDSVRRALEEELARLSSLTTGPGHLTHPVLTEPLDPEGKLVRVNLEPLRSDRNAVTRLVRALIETARTIPADSAVMQQRLAEAIAWCQERIPDQAVWLQEMADAAPREGFPPIHHSKVYETAYRPAYRVVRRDLWEQTKSEVR